MKRSILKVIALLFLGINSTMAQNTDRDFTYCIIVNNVPDEFNFPLIGIVNNANGNHTSAQLGIVNSTKQNFIGAQAGFVNSIGNNLYGIQYGFINSVEKDVYGLEIGFINSVGNEVSGFQAGFINTAKKLTGIQNGFINISGSDVDGIQNGFINSLNGNLKGLQVGFINSAPNETKGAQVGYVNSTRKLTGLQLGFLNFVDTLDKGLPVGFLSFVKHGGYSAFELSISEMYPVNISYKIGTEKFYSFPIVSYNQNLTHKYAVGLGIGSNLPLNDHFFFNPEIVSQYAVSLNYRHIQSLSTNFGYKISDQLQISAGPSVVWNRTSSESASGQNFFSIYNYNFNTHNSLSIGLRAAIRYKFNNN